MFSPRCIRVLRIVAVVLSAVAQLIIIIFG